MNWLCQWRGWVGGLLLSLRQGTTPRSSRPDAAPAQAKAFQLALLVIGIQHWNEILPKHSSKRTRN